ncbi:glutamyl-tRNA reductase [Ferruginivarius sediminum]|uniref:Glutamyl-tRNA reductase n=1 Tax=Ferruginivarius sediminum TaxID=2661937 RepID=A0A369T6P0_9PROT|nr:glutamyl-tRNA reductase [Ferruginivarius sediminum]RDD60989.1 glutamyl-tRNA reductase [Ferruginivarius sediminum]
MAAADAAGNLLVVGLNYRAAPPSARERLFSDEPDYAQLLADVRAAGLQQAAVIATCERVEIAALTAEPSAAEITMSELLARWADAETETLAPMLSIARGQAGLRHLFAVAAALDSQIVGEPQVFGQFRESHRAARAAGLLGRELDAVLQQACTVARRVRSETALAEHPVSIAAAAVKVARQVHGDLRRAKALLLGLGEMGEIMAGQLREAAIAGLTLTHPVHRRAEAMARRAEADLRPWPELAAAIAEADIVVACLGQGHYTLTAREVSLALKRRRQRPMFIMDAAVPGDVEPAVEDLEPAFVYDLGDLERVAQEGRARREAAALAAWRIVDEELDAFQSRQSQRDAAPTLAAFSERLETLRAEILASGKLDAEAATHQLIRRLLHEPSRVLRSAATTDEAELAELERSLQRLFRLGTDGQGEGKEDRRNGNGGKREEET